MHRIDALITLAPDEPPPAEGRARPGSPWTRDQAAQPLLSAVVRVLDKRLAELEIEIDTAMIIGDLERTRVLMDRWALLNDRRNELLDGV